ncbi:hypothetical protein BGAL_0755g00010 [Botrytis galanthina]|uniref:Uncharacterized protein n=1 Tax=Botrytis galanthina TaxID=278940 RepID=A0A4S8QLV1_9HELO|nr:hypothetical protein BGAL_0755g00010 [Botrytis galanthina]
MPSPRRPSSSWVCKGEPPKLFGEQSRKTSGRPYVPAVWLAPTLPRDQTAVQESFQWVCWGYGNSYGFERNAVEVFESLPVA